MKHTLALLLVNICFSCLHSYAQNYIPFRNNLNEAEYWFYEQKWDSAIIYYEKAENFGYKFFPKDSHLYSRVLWETGNKKKSLDILLKGGVKLYFKNDTTYYLGMDKKLREKILSDLPPDSIMVPPNMSLFDTLIKYDQQYRKELRSISKEDTMQYNIVKSKINQQDSINRELFLGYISEYGFPGGYYYTDPKVSTIVIHIPPDWLFKHYNVFLSEIKAGRMNPYDFAIILDRAFSDDSCKTQTLYNLYVPNNTVVSTSPELIFINSCLLGLSPYFDNRNNFISSRGKSPKKSNLYNYYSEKKKDFNCSQFR